MGKVISNAVVRFGNVDDFGGLEELPFSILVRSSNDPQLCIGTVPPTVGQATSSVLDNKGRICWIASAVIEAG